MLHIFIDTNVLLSFYSFTQDDLTRLELLATQVEGGTFVILTTTHVRNEFRRNREAKIAESRKEFSSKRLDMKFPTLCDAYAETAELRRLAREYSQAHGRLVEKIDADAALRTLKADQLIERFFGGAKTIDVTADIVERARLRVDMGNPPGKRGSLGDALNWEALLGYGVADQLVFVTDDADFYSPLNSDRPREFLVDEWGESVGHPIGFVRRLSELPEPVPHEALPAEDAPDERDAAVSQLMDSGNFAWTHHAISELSRFDHFTARQVRNLVAATSNSQVGWIIGDEDVRGFYQWLLETHKDSMSGDEATYLSELLEPPVLDEPEGDAPF